MDASPPDRIETPMSAVPPLSAARAAAEREPRRREPGIAAAVLLGRGSDLVRSVRGFSNPEVDAMDALAEADCLTAAASSALEFFELDARSLAARLAALLAASG